MNVKLESGRNANVLPATIQKIQNTWNALVYQNFIDDFSCLGFNFTLDGPVFSCLTFDASM